MYLIRFASTIIGGLAVIMVAAVLANVVVTSASGKTSAKVNNFTPTLKNQQPKQKPSCRHKCAINQTA